MDLSTLYDAMKSTTYLVDLIPAICVIYGDVELGMGEQYGIHLCLSPPLIFWRLRYVPEPELKSLSTIIREHSLVEGVEENVGVNLIMAQSCQTQSSHRFSALGMG
mmetsp:Transcript_21772/g.41079  ORF Transcript_21772/g.41079 Transcript_21772/m.41079 type:complete len:106 (+) Transcript_21772:62-379(+)